MTREEFHKVALSYLESKYPDLEPKIGELPFSIDLKDKRTIYLDNAYTECQKSNFENWQPVVDNYLNALGEDFQNLDTNNWDSIKTIILPQIKHIDHINFANDENKKRNENFSPLVYKDFVDELKICLVIDTPKSYVYVNEEYLAIWGKSFDELYAIALENLLKLPESQKGPMKYIDDKTKRVTVVFETNDGYDAARILLPIFYKALSIDLGQEFVVAMPARDLLVCVSMEDLEMMKNLLPKMLASGHHPISSKLYVHDAEGLRVLEG